MKFKNIILKAVCLMMMTLTVIPGRAVFADGKKVKASDKPEKLLPPYAVVELFTSEGCSTCPPADEFLADLVQRTKNTGPVYALSFHVDYWDQAGWKDPFSSSIFTQRQRAYAYTKGEKDLYTPQMYVNGQEGFVGSNKEKAIKNIRMALEKSAAVGVDLTARVPKNLSFLKVEFKVSPKGTKDKMLYLALVKEGIVSQVTAGENAGKIIPHENVVMGFKSVRLSERREGGVEFIFNPSENLEKFSVIAYVQDPKTMLIYGANRVDFRPQSRVSKNQ